MPDEIQPSRVKLLERTLKEIANLAEKHPDNVPVQRARILAEAALNAPLGEMD
jgi:hypothetical protein